MTAPATAAPQARLTSRQRQVLQLVAAGLNGPAIAAELDISIATVKFHLRDLRAALGARTSAHAVAIAFHRRLLVVHPLRVSINGIDQGWNAA